MLKIPTRAIYAGATVFIFITELLIALLVNDSFVRPYVGDILVTILICCFIRVLFLQKIKFLPIYVFLLATAVEICQYFNFVSVIGLYNIKFFKVLLGATFSVADLFCYAFGCLLFFILETVFIKRKIQKTSE